MHRIPDTSRTGSHLRRRLVRRDKPSQPPGRPKQGRWLAGGNKTVWSFADQALSSGTNFALTVLVARTVDPPAFGAFAVAVSVYLICLTLGRFAVSEPNVMSIGRPDGLTQEAIAAGLAATLILAGVAGVLTLGAAALTGGAYLPLLLVVLAVGLPGLLAQDYRRAVFFALGQPHRAFVSDGLWAVLQLAGIAIAALNGVRSPAAFLAVWAGSGLLSGVLWPGVTRGWKLTEGAAWIRRERALVFPLAGEGLLFQAGNQVSLFILGAMTGLAQTGAYRGAQSLFGPVTVVSQGVRTATLPRLMRVSRGSADSALRTALRSGLGIAGVAALWGAVLAALPDAVGEQILGRTWPLAAPLLALVAIDRVGNALSLGAALQLRVLMRPRHIFIVRVITTVVGLVAAVIGTILGKAWGVALAFAVISPFLAAIAYLAVYLARRSDLRASGVPACSGTVADPSVGLPDPSPREVADEAANGRPRSS